MNLRCCWAYTKTKMSNLLAIDYTRLIFSTMLGYSLFGEIIGLNTLLGTAIILASSIYLATTRKKETTEKQAA